MLQTKRLNKEAFITIGHSGSPSLGLIDHKRSRTESFWDPVLSLGCPGRVT